MNLVVRSFSTSFQRIILLPAFCRCCGPAQCSMKLSECRRIMSAGRRETLERDVNRVRVRARVDQRAPRHVSRQRKMRVRPGRGIRVCENPARKAARCRPGANFVPQRFPPLQRFRINYTESNPFLSLRNTLSRGNTSVYIYIYIYVCVYIYTRICGENSAVSIRTGIPPKGRKDRPPGNMEFFSSKNSQESSHRERERERDLLRESIESRLAHRRLLHCDICDVNKMRKLTPSRKLFAPAFRRNPRVPSSTTKRT